MSRDKGKEPGAVHTSALRVMAHERRGMPAAGAPLGRSSEGMSLREGRLVVGDPQDIRCRSRVGCGMVRCTLLGALALAGRGAGCLVR